jgi:predicted MarR family transcription regulator
MTAEDRRIVSSRHLAEGEGWEASEFEYGLIIAYHAFTRWMQRCMTAAGMPELSALEILVLHNANHRDREKRLSDICFMLNIEDAHTVNYALRKLLKLALLTSAKRGKEVFYSASPAGRDLCETYRNIRRQCLLSSQTGGAMTPERLREVASALRAMSGQYDQASRAAAAL